MGRSKGALVLLAALAFAGGLVPSHPRSAGAPAVARTVAPVASAPPASSPGQTPPFTLIGTPAVDGHGAVLQAPPPSAGVPWVAGQSCSSLGEAGSVVRCGTTAELVWLVESHTPGTGGGVRASIFRQDGAGQLELVLRAGALDGAPFGEVRTSVADVSGDGRDDLVFAFYRLGPGEVLSVDVVESPGEVTVHRDYFYGSARATRGQLDGWAERGAISPGASSLAHETIRFNEGAWRVVGFETTATTSVYPRDFPDPFVLRVGPLYLGYATNTSGSNVPVVRSSDLRTWARLPDALPQLPDWSAPGRVWAPSVLPRPGGYVLYYTTRNRASGQQCVSRAWAAVPEGPFRDDSSAGLICQVDRGGSIDPSPFVDTDGTPWLYWKSDGVAGGEGPTLWVQRLSSDGLSLVGSATDLLREDQAWEAPVIEGPAMIREDGRYYLFYVAGPWQTAGYAIGYATCASPQGPCTKPQDLPLVASTGTLAGPGGPEFFIDGEGRRWMSLHGWGAPDVGYPRGRRMLFLLPVHFEDHRPIVGATPEVS